MKVNPLDRFGSSPSSREAIAICALVLSFLTIALGLTLSFDDFPTYRSVPNEIFDASRHELLASEAHCRADWCDDIPSRWRNTADGQTFERVQFRDHRWNEALRLSFNWFMLSSVGAVMASWYCNHFMQASFADRFGLFLGMAAVTAAVFGFQVL